MGEEPTFVYLAEHVLFSIQIVAFLFEAQFGAGHWVVITNANIAKEFVVVHLFEHFLDEVVGFFVVETILKARV